MRASVAAIRGGVPSVAIVGSHFKARAKTIECSLGVQDSGMAVYPGHIRLDDENEFCRKVATDIVDQIISELGNVKISPARKSGEHQPREIVFRGSIDEVNAHFYDAQWTEGLPVIPPTLDRIDAFMKHTARRPDEVIGVLLPERREATVWNVAVNGVMSGCLPEYMPVLLALVEAIADPEFRIEDHGSTPGWEPLIVISGPVTKALDFNFGTGVMRPGRRANTAIGNPFNVIIAEAEDFVRSIGWPTYGMERGLKEGESGVTVQSMMGASAPMAGHGAEGNDLLGYLDPMADVFGKAILGYWVHTVVAFAHWDPLIIMNPQIAKLAADKGWSKNDIRNYLYERAQIPARDVEFRGRFVNLELASQLEKGIVPAAYGASKDPDRLVPCFYTPESIGIVIAGNPATTWQRGYMNNHEQGAAVTKNIAWDRG